MAFPDDYKWKLDITTDSTKIDSNESNFPFYFDLSNISSSDFWNNVQSDGGDLRVSTSSDGTGQVPLEVVSIDTTGQTGEIHFKDSTDSASNKTYYLWWDDSTGTVSQPANTDTFGRNNVWTNNQSFVYHHDESSGTTITDSTGSNDGTLTDGGGVTLGVSGQLGNSIRFSQGSGQDDWITVPSAVLSSSGDFSLSFWVNVNDSSNNSTLYLGRDDRQLILRHQQEGTNNNQMYVWDGSWNSLSSMSDGEWHHLVATYDDSANNFELYIDGTNTDSLNLGHSSEDASNNLIGNAAGGGSEWNGEIDESRTYDGSILSSGWVSTEYNMQSSNSTFWTVGTAEKIETDETATVTTSTANTLTSVEDVTDIASIVTSTANVLASTDAKNPLSGTVTLDGSQVSGANVYAYNETKESFVGQDETNASGDYEITGDVDSGDEVLIAVDYDDGTTRYGDEKSTQL